MNRSKRNLDVRRHFRARRHRRRGVLLIIVLSLLVMFALIGFTFVLVAGHYDRAARASIRTGLTDDQGRDLIEQAFYDLLRGTNNPNSILFTNDDDGDGLVDEDVINGTDDDGDGLVDEDPVGRIAGSLLEDLYGNDGVVGGTIELSQPLGQQNNAPYQMYTLNGTFAPHYNAYAGRIITILSGRAAMLSARIVLSVKDPGVFPPGGKTIVFVERFRSLNGNTNIFGDPGNRFIISGRPLNGSGVDAIDEPYDAPDRLNPHLAFIPTDAPTTPLIPSFAARVLDLDGDNAHLDPDDFVVDNDQDGLVDSGWLDFGFETKTTSDGRRYKPYAAVLCVDLDGRLNLNAHGSLAQLNTNYTSPHTAAWAGGGGATQAISSRRGMGFGPADINLSNLFPAAKYQAILDSRHGSDFEPGPVGAELDNRWRLRGLAIPTDYTTTPVGNTARGYAGHPDVHGRGMIGVDYAGRPLTFNMGLTDEFTASPYQVDLIRKNGQDNPFTMAELERVLRWNDIDRDTLPALWEREPALAESDFSSQEIRRSITVASSHVPVTQGNVDVLAMLWERLANAGFAEIESGGPIGFKMTRADEVRKLLGFSLINGGKMNVNRPWGNSVDNNSNGIIDELTELSTAETLTDWTPAPYATAPAADYLNFAPDLKNQSMGRYHYARHLFSLMMLVRETNHKHAFANEPALSDGVPDVTTDDAMREELTIRRIAQWAINCVDFRDPDAIMTPFEYDVNPFNGWNVDGYVGDNPGPDGVLSTTSDNTNDSGHADRRVVWGMEFPDALLTETLAFHDRRMRDTEWDNYSDSTDEEDHADHGTTGQGSRRLHAEDNADGNKKKGDKDLDQVRMPEGSLFVELYCTRNKVANNPVVPAELYTNSKLDLGKMAGSYPVWRLAISRAHNQGHLDGQTHYDNSPEQRRSSHPVSTAYQPDHPDGTVYPFEQMSLLDNTTTLEIERYVWFSKTPPPAAGANDMNLDNTFYNRDPSTDNDDQLPPGNYLVVGPREKTYVGSKPDADPLAPTTIDGDQYIDLATGVSYQNIDASATPPTNIVTPVQTIVAAIDANYTNASNQRGLNVSEPFPISSAAGTPYPDTSHARESYGDGTSATYLDEPLDKADNRPLAELDGTIDDTQQTQKVDNYRSVFLQRLANPLQRWNPPAGHAEHDNTLPLNPYVTVDWQPVDLTVFNGEDREPDGWDEAQLIGPDPGEAIGEFDPDDPNANWSNGGAVNPEFGSRQRRDLPGNQQNLWNPRSESQLQAATGDPATQDDYFHFDLKHSLGYLNEGYGATLGGSALGDPASGPFPWLMWPNRPFVSHYELMLVPASQQSRLTSEVTVAQTSGPYTSETGMFGHLLNFYQSSATTGESPHYYRILDFLEVPSNYAASTWWYDPAYANTYTYAVFFGLQFKAPFHGTSRFQDPGRVNINTIPGRKIWEAIDNNGTNGTAFVSWDKLDASRRGTIDPLGRFTNPFTGSKFVAGGTSITSSNLDTSLFRRDLDTSTNTETNLPLFGPPTAASARNDTTQNAYFRTQGLQALGNLVTTQSNVYAIWITIGYFEVDAAGNPLRELGQDTGEIRRHRGFYIVDRSIPVGFELGKNHNVEQAVLTRRFIE